MSSSSEAGLVVAGVAPMQLRDLSALDAPNALAQTLLGSLASEAHDQGYRDGYVAGRTEGRAEALATAQAEAEVARSVRRATELREQAEHSGAVAALESAAAQVRSLLEELTARVEDQATTLALAIVETIIAREVATATPADVVRRVLQVLPPTATATVRLHPSIVSTGVVQDLLALGLVVLGDESLEPADALVESDGSVVDLRIDAAMQRVREVLA
jgi:flagellar assembly protein FliH